MTQITTDGVITDKRSFRQFGHIEAECSGENHVTTVDLVFRLATNGILLVTEVNAEGLMAFSIASFRR